VRVEAPKGKLPEYSLRTPPEEVGTAKLAEELSVELLDAANMAAAVAWLLPAEAGMAEQELKQVFAAVTAGIDAWAEQG
jgi:hypothetical protein